VIAITLYKKDKYHETYFVLAEPKSGKPGGCYVQKWLADGGKSLTNINP
jgi:hypothetical protein